jgi:hypothetical protein
MISTPIKRRYKSQIPVVEQVIERAAMMLGTDKVIASR